MPRNPKQIREVDKDYKEFIKTQPCLVNHLLCCGEVACHHTKSVGSGGSDRDGVPLCLVHHIPGVHSMGIKTFQDVYGIDFKKEIKRLNELYERLKHGIKIK